MSHLYLSWALRAPGPVGQGSAFAPGSPHGSPGPCGPATPPGGRPWCIVVALHVLVVPMQCFHSASQRPALSSTDSPPRPWRRALLRLARGHARRRGRCMQPEGQHRLLTGEGGPGFAPERKSVPEGQTLSPSLAFGPRWLSWHFWPEVASGPGQRASPAGQAVYRTGRDQSLRGGRISLVPSPAGLLSCLSSRGNQSQPDLGNGREAVRTVGATLLGDRSV